MCKYCNGTGFYRMLTPTEYQILLAETNSAKERDEAILKIAKTYPCYYMHRKMYRIKLRAEKAKLDGNTEVEQS